MRWYYVILNAEGTDYDEGTLYASEENAKTALTDILTMRFGVDGWCQEGDQYVRSGTPVGQPVLGYVHKTVTDLEALLLQRLRRLQLVEKLLLEVQHIDPSLKIGPDMIEDRLNDTYAAIHAAHLEDCRPHVDTDWETVEAFINQLHPCFPNACDNDPSPATIRHALQDRFHISFKLASELLDRWIQGDSI